MIALTPRVIPLALLLVTSSCSVVIDRAIDDDDTDAARPCGDYTCSGPENALYALTAADPVSVMNDPAVCVPEAFDDFEVSYLDRLGAASVYGPSRRADPRLPIRRWRDFDDEDWITVGPGEISDELLTNESFKQTTFSFYAQGHPSEGAVAVYRWWHAGRADWVTFVEGEASDVALVAAGYSKKTFQFYARATADVTTVPVHKWFHTGWEDWVTVANELSDAEMISFGYSNKTFLFHAPNSRSEVVPVFRYRHAPTGTWSTFGANELTDVQLSALGYGERRFQFFALTSCATGCVAVNRFRHAESGRWDTFVAGERTDEELEASGYESKTFQFFVPAEPIENITSPVYRWTNTATHTDTVLCDAESPDRTAGTFGTRDSLLFHGLQ